MNSDSVSTVSWCNDVILVLKFFFSTSITSVHQVQGAVFQKRNKNFIFSAIAVLTQIEIMKERPVFEATEYTDIIIL